MKNDFMDDDCDIEGFPKIGVFPIKQFLDNLRKQGVLKKWERVDVENDKKYIIEFN